MNLLIILLLAVSVQARELSFSFMAKTNMPGVSVEGKSLSAISFEKSKNGELVIELKNISTEMELRDEHMRKEIFNNKNIKISFMELSDCKTKKICQIKLKININEVLVEKVLNLKNTDKEMKGQIVLNLKEFGVTPPSKFGVRVLPDVELKLNVKN